MKFSRSLFIFLKRFRLTFSTLKYFSCTKSGGSSWIWLLLISIEAILEFSFSGALKRHGGSCSSLLSERLMLMRVGQTTWGSPRFLSLLELRLRDLRLGRESKLDGTYSSKFLLRLQISSALSPMTSCSESATILLKLAFTSKRWSHSSKLGSLSKLLLLRLRFYNFISFTKESWTFSDYSLLWLAFKVVKFPD